MVRDQLWLWVEEIKASSEQLNSASAQVQRQDEGTLNALELIENTNVPDDCKVTHQEDTKDDRHKGGSSVVSGGGPIFMGNIKAGRDFTYNGR